MDCPQVQNNSKWRTLPTKKEPPQLYRAQPFHPYGYTPMDIQEVLTQSTSEVTFGERLRQVAEEFLGLANNEIKNQNSFGILKLMGQTTE